MRKLFLSILLLALSYTSWGTTVTGHITNFTLPVPNGHLQLTIQGCSNPMVGGGGPPVYMIGADISGLFTSTVFGNDVITCFGVTNNTWYQIVAFDSSFNIIWTNYYLITGASWNLDTASPMSVIPTPIVFPHSLTCSGTDKLNSYNATTGLFDCGLDQTGLNYTLRCEEGMGDGVNPIPIAVYPKSKCYNDTQISWQITGIRCYTDTGGSSLNAVMNIGGDLLATPISCSSIWAAGSLETSVILAPGDYIKFAFIADGNTTQTTWVVSFIPLGN